MNASQFKLLLIALSLGGYGWLAFNWHSETESRSFCPMKNLSGLPCPSCGTTRSTMLLTKGDILNAIQINPLGLLAFGFLILAPCWLLYDHLKRKDSAWLTFRWFENKIQSNVVISISLIVLVAINWIWNIYKGL
jgi:hypothetical protein